MAETSRTTEPAGYYTSRFSGEEIDDLLSSIGGGSLITTGTDDLPDGASLPTGTLYVKYE